MIVHFDFLDEVISFLLHIGHQLLEENPFIVNPQHLISEFTNFPAVLIADEQFTFMLLLRTQLPDGIVFIQVNFIYSEWFLGQHIPFLIVIVYYLNCY